MAPVPDTLDDDAVVDACTERSIALLERNLSPEGILAATPAPDAAARGYLAIFGRDAAVCALGMAVSGHPTLEREAAAGLVTLARHQARNGQMPKFVDVARNEADFWYLGCIDATLWWLIAIALLDGQPASRGLRASYAAQAEAALRWLDCQEHQRFHLLQQNEASDWADIMPRSGFVLYTNALWCLVKRLYGVGDAEATRSNFNGLFFPFTADLHEYRRARLLAHYSRKARHRDLYLSFVNFSFFGDEGDVFGNVLAVLCGAADSEAARRTMRALAAARVADPYPVRVVCDPILEANTLWRPYMSRHRQNYAWQYHNGGIWPFVGAFYAAALAATDEREAAAHALAQVARANALDDWAFAEWLHGRTHARAGMKGQSWNAGAFLLARHALARGTPALLPGAGG
ncbi:MAG TPA: glycoside hydrolase 100 family protein [Casimicrobiaceae bacterium]|nr:glycoside hydrolase 100 family protein [Casimicrobiaceae bacterium]